MHQVHQTRLLLHHPFLQQAAKARAAPKSGSSIRYWIGAVVRNWQRRKMIAALHALEDRTLRDIGMERCDIEEVVEMFNERELCMVPLEPSDQAEQVDQSFRQAA